MQAIRPAQQSPRLDDIAAIQGRAHPAAANWNIVERHRGDHLQTDAGLLADHLIWASTTPAAANSALNIVNGDVFRWRRLWPRLAAALDVDPKPFDGEPAPLERQMADAAEIWPDIVHRHGLHDVPIERLASWWHTDADLGRTIETFTDMGRSRRLGFLGVRDTESSFTDLFARLRARRIVP